MEEEDEGHLDGDVLLSPDTLDPSLLKFMEHNHIPHDAYNISQLYRFIRIKPNSGVTVEELSKQLGTEIVPVSWLPNFYRLQHDIGIATCEAYNSGHIYGIDASSGAAVVALNPQPGDNVLDLCCAPGAKLCMIADLLDGKGTLTGVDIAEKRLGSCRNMMAKYNIQMIRLFLEDATTFRILAPPKGTKEENGNESEKGNEEQEKAREREKGEEKGEGATPYKVEQRARRDRGYKRTSNGELVASRWRKKRLRNKKDPGELPNVFYANPMELSLESSNECRYDKIMLDAQCTLDASVRHILKYRKLGWKEFKVEITAETVDLQKRMIKNAFELLAPGGTLIYSTCSFSQEQNEDVVSWLVQENSEAYVVPVEGAEKMPCKEGTLAHTLRFYPVHTGTSGLFIAKIMKR